MPTLFESYDLGPIRLANRLVMNPMTRSRSDEAGLANELMAEYYAQRAGAGLIVTEGVAPHPDGRGYARIPGLWNKAQSDSWKPVTAAVHARGGKIFAQLMHSGRIAHPANLPAGARVVAPSALAAPGQMHTDSLGMQPHPVPSALDEAGVRDAIAGYANAAVNAVAAGFDGVELHGANGYLLEQFLSPHTNQRNDAWGGSVDKRLRFVVEAARETAKAIGGGKVGIRLSPYGVNGGMLPYPEIDESYLKLAALLDSAGLVYLHIADHSAMGAPAVSETLKRELRRAWPRTLLLGGSFNHDSAEEAVRLGKADLVGVGRALLANPDLVTRWQKGLPLNTPDPSTFFSPGPKGYTDYPVVV